MRLAASLMRLSTKMLTLHLLGEAHKEPIDSCALDVRCATDSGAKADASGGPSRATRRPCSIAWLVS